MKVGFKVGDPEPEKTKMNSQLDVGRNNENFAKVLLLKRING